MGDSENINRFLEVSGGGIEGGEEVAGDERIFKDLELEKRKKREITRLKKLFKEVPKEKMDTVRSLVDNAAFMTVQLEDLQVIINQKGVTSEYRNSETQYGTKKSPEVEIYNSMIKNHMSIIRQLTDLLPKEPPKEVDDGFDMFVGGRQEF